MQLRIINTLFLALITSMACSLRADQPVGASSNVDYETDVAPILKRYCAGCHNDTDMEGDFSLSSLQSLQKGTPEGGPVVVAGSAEKSLLFQLIIGKEEPAMPPEDEPQLSDEQKEMIRAWIEKGLAAGPMTPRLVSNAPALKPALPRHQYVSAAAATKKWLAVGKLGRVEMFDRDGGKPTAAISDLPGKVNVLKLHPDGQQLIAGSGVAGLGGQIVWIDTVENKIVKRWDAHSDAIYALAVSADGRWLASGSYDRRIIIWDVGSGSIKHELSGHNGAIYDLDFDPTSRVLASASADQTVKLWNVDSGERLDTLGQPEGEMLCVRFDAAGQHVLAGGSDRQLRKWKLESLDSPAINPMLVARYAHEDAILYLDRLGRDLLVSASADKTVKLWNSSTMSSLGELVRLDEAPTGLVGSSASEREPKDAQSLVAIDLAGNVHQVKHEKISNMLRQASKTAASDLSRNAAVTKDASTLGQVTQFTESEPNHDLQQANGIQLPAVISGKIDFEEANKGFAEDVDLVRFHAEEGQQWILEIDAAAKKSQLDSRIEVLDENGNPVIRDRLQAVRESYFTFRGKDSDTSDDFRLHKWEDMELDEFLYAGGEVTRLWLYPRGPDSGFKVYPGAGKRHTFFGSTPVSHALGDPAYIVRPLAKDEEPLPNGLPVFPVYFENDDDGRRAAGKDSRLTFTAPRTGVYFVRLRDARGFSGPEFHYQLSIRAPEPDFDVTVGGNKLQLPVGSGREWNVKVNRKDGLDSAVEVSIQGLPEGLLATNPLVVEAGQQSALGTVYATEELQTILDQVSKAVDDSQEPKTEKKADENVDEQPQPEPIQLQLIARTEYQGQVIEKALAQKLEIQVTDTQEVQLKLVSADSPQSELEELTIRPGQTVSAKVIVERNGTKSRIGFGKDDSGRNLPHGAYVDNIGLNGLLITESQTEREFFITAAPKLQPGRRQFHLRSDTKGNPTSRPVWLNVLPVDSK